MGKQNQHNTRIMIIMDNKGGDFQHPLSPVTTVNKVTGRSPSELRPQAFKYWPYIIITETLPEIRKKSGFQFGIDIAIN